MYLKLKTPDFRIVLSVLIASAPKTLRPNPKWPFLVGWIGCLASRADDKKLWAIKMDKSQNMIIILRTHDVSVVNNDGGASSITYTWPGNLTHEQNLGLQDESHAQNVCTIITKLPLNLCIVMNK